MQRCFGLWLGLLVLVAGCGAPVLRNGWRPDPHAVAIGSLAVATLASLLDPEAHHRRIEQAYLDAMPEERPMRVTEIVTSEVLDRLDAAQAQRYASR
jgi:hypothetical protein